MKNRISTEGVDARAALGREPKGEPSPRRLSNERDGDGLGGEGWEGRRREREEEIRRSREDGPKGNERQWMGDTNRAPRGCGIWQGKGNEKERRGQRLLSRKCSSARGSRTDRRDTAWPVPGRYHLAAARVRRYGAAHEDGCTGTGCWALTGDAQVPANCSPQLESFKARPEKLLLDLCTCTLCTLWTVHAGMRLLLGQYGTVHAAPSKEWAE